MARRRQCAPDPCWSLLRLGPGASPVCHWVNLSVRWPSQPRQPGVPWGSVLLPGNPEVGLGPQEQSLGLAFGAPTPSGRETVYVPGGVLSGRVKCAAHSVLPPREAWVPDAALAPIDPQGPSILPPCRTRGPGTGSRSRTWAGRRQQRRCRSIHRAWGRSAARDPHPGPERVPREHRAPPWPSECSGAPRSGGRTPGASAWGVGDRPRARAPEGAQGGACVGWRPRPGLPQQVGAGKSVLRSPGMRRAGCGPRRALGGGSA